GAMDFATRNLYRNAIEQLARGSPASELDVVDAALEASRTAAADAGEPVEAERVRDPGYHLIAGGRAALEQTLGFRPPLRLRISRYGIRLGLGGYVGAITLVAALLLALALRVLTGPGVGAGWLALFAVIAFVPATEVATALVNRALSWS